MHCRPQSGASAVALPDARTTISEASRQPELSAVLETQV